jgi:tRNA threonylcarbamoyladenosine biosynthesis protein TsaB
MLAGREELAAINPPPARIAICDEAAAALIQTAWPAAEIARVPAPTAADALALAAPRVERGEFANVETLDGHYLRRSDAEIFGPSEPSKP